MKYWAIGALVVGLPLLGLVGLWLWVLSAGDPAAHPVGKTVPLPVACTTRGCLTSRRLTQAYDVSAAFARSNGAEPPTSAVVLTTLIRQHVVEHAQITSPVSAEDARRYREEILNQRDGAVIEQATTLSLEEYDRAVILPYLQQEALRQQRHIESLDELYTQLARERWVLVLPIALRWDRASGSVAPRAWYVPAG